MTNYTSAPDTCPVSAYDSIECTLLSARGLANDVVSVVNALIGFEPECESASSNRLNVPSGVLPHLASTAADAAESIASARAALRRLHAYIPQIAREAGDEKECF